MSLFSRIGTAIADHIISIGENRPYDFPIGPKNDPYMLRWWLIPRNRFFNVYLHQIRHDDEDRACHDHPFDNVSILLRGSYIECIEQVIDQSENGEVTSHSWKIRNPGSVVFRKATARHRLLLFTKSTWGGVDNGFQTNPMFCWSLFITGPRRREWGFWCPKGFVHWKKFVDMKNPGEVGPGCGD